MAEFLSRLKSIVAVMLAFLGITVAPTEPIEPPVIPVKRVIEEIDGNLLSVCDSTFEKGTVLEGTAWSAFDEGALSIGSGKNGGNAIQMSDRQNEWSSPAIDLFGAVEANGAGTYILSYLLHFDADTRFCGSLIRGTRANSFISEDRNGLFYCRLNEVNNQKADEWIAVESIFTVSEQDIAENDSWRFCIDGLSCAIAVKLDNIVLKKAEGFAEPAAESIPQSCEAWVANEIVLLSDKQYSNPLFENEAQIVLTHSDGTVLTVPGFWDGGKAWRFRFALTKPGKWAFETECTDPDNTSLARTGAIQCSVYSGDLEIYKRGFVTAENGKRYFTYADGTPFFYLGDTHWSMPTEEFDSAGDHTDNAEIYSHFKHIVDKRAEQGFTVYQSEPIGAQYDLSDGLDSSDINGFKDLDRRFDYIARRGLVHANAQLFYSSELVNNYGKYSAEYLTRLSRYWAARYSAYPVLWTTGQEVDNDFYFNREINGNIENTVINSANNPWKIVLEKVTLYDAYNHPGTAHQETCIDSINGTKASTSSFRDVPGHNWYAAQWAPSLNSTAGVNEIARDYWNNAQGKVVINYEGRYENLWTKDFGARAQGWISFLSGMYGYGYGAVDMWYYKSSYDTQSTTNDSVTDITPDDKAVTWEQSLHFESVNRLRIMRGFLERNEWYRLVPRFDDREWVNFGKNACGVLASNGNDTYVSYFYGQSTLLSTTLMGLDNCSYTKQWFNPRTGEYRAADTVKPLCGRLHIVSKPDKGDWVLVVKKQA